MDAPPSRSRVAVVVVAGGAALSAVLCLPGCAFAALVALAALPALFELRQLAPEAGGGRVAAVAAVVAILATCAAAPGTTWRIGLVAASAHLLAVSRRPPYAVLAIAYVGAPLAVLASAQRDDPRVALLMLGAPWARDVGAFFAGRSSRAWPALCPQASDSKTLVGALGGLAAAGAGTAAWCRSFGVELGHADLVATTALIAVMGQWGDLFESRLKRVAGRRHSGRLFGDEGGMLDVLDGTLFVAPWLALWFAWRPPGCALGSAPICP